MTAIELYELLSSRGPSWGSSFSKDEILKAINKAKNKLRIVEYVQLPYGYLPKVAVEVVQNLNKLDPVRMKAALDRDYKKNGKENNIDFEL